MGPDPQKRGADHPGYLRRQHSQARVNCNQTVTGDVGQTAPLIPHGVEALHKHRTEDFIIATIKCTLEDVNTIKAALQLEIERLWSRDPEAVKALKNALAAVNASA